MEPRFLNLKYPAAMGYLDCIPVDFHFNVHHMHAQSTSTQCLVAASEREKKHVFLAFLGKLVIL